MRFNRYDHSPAGKIVPRFQLKIDCNPELALTHLDTRIGEDRTVFGHRSNQLIFLKTPSWNQHFWSPEMTVRIEVEEYTDFTTVSCLIGPRQSVWTMIAFAYAAIALTTLFALMFGLVQYFQDGYSVFLWFIPFGILLFSTIFILSKYGQQKGRDQMLHLVSFLYHNLDAITTVERIED